VGARDVGVHDQVGAGRLIEQRVDRSQQLIFVDAVAHGLAHAQVAQDGVRLGEGAGGHFHLNLDDLGLVDDLGLHHFNLLGFAHDHGDGHLDGVGRRTSGEREARHDHQAKGAK
jgi:hypothetical protein